MTAHAMTTSRAADAYVLAPGEGELRWTGTTRTRFVATGDLTAGLFCLVDETAAKGEVVPLHRHADDVESFFLLEGELSLFMGGGGGVRSGPGSFAHIPAGVVHGFRVESETARYLILTTPQHGEFYRAITLASRADGTAPDGSVGGDAVREACERFNIEFVGPLPA